MKINNCPVCNHTHFSEVFPEFHGKTISSDLHVIEKSSLINVCCNNCGLIFNASGTRFIQNYYEDCYEYFTDDPDSQTFSFIGKLEPLAKKLYSFMDKHLQLKKSGSNLEIGAGKGDFLTIFETNKKDWSFDAIEPSCSVKYLKRNTNKTNIFNCFYTDFEAKKQYDIITSFSVLEHVDNPLDFLNWVHKHLKEDGVFFMMVPHFDANASDLFCVDHLTKFTKATVVNLAAHSGFTLHAHEVLGIPALYLLKKTNNLMTLTNSFLKNYSTAEKNREICERNLLAFKEGYETALDLNEPFAIFGVNSAGLFAPFYYDLNIKNISCIIDENPSTLNSKVIGLTVKGLTGILENGIKHIYINASQRYHSQIINKLTPFGINIYKAD